MKLFFSAFLLFVATNVLAQLEVSTGYAVDKNLADGLPVQLAYDFQIKKRLFTKFQIGYKYLHHFNDFVGADLDVSIFELHQTLSYEIVKKRKYIFKPNVGVNYRFYHWKGKMRPPHNTLPQRALVIDVRGDPHFILNSFDNGYFREYRVNNIGFSFQLQNQFRFSDKVWLHVTPFLEPDYDRSKNTGGCYVGIILPRL